MEKFKSCLCRIKDAIGYLLLFISVFCIGSIFLLAGICIGIFSAMCSALQRFWHHLKSKKHERPKFPIKSDGKCRNTVRTIGQIMVLAGVMGVIKVITKAKQR